MNLPSKIRILLADDHTMFREGVKQVLSASPDFQVVDEAGNAQEVLEKVPRANPDVLVLDISMPGRDGIDVLKQLRHLYPRLHVLVLSMYPEDQYAFRSIKAGASGYLTKSKASAELIEAIRKIASGLTVKQIAGELAISVSSVSTLRARILAKFGMKTNAQITHYAIKHDLVK